MTETAAMPRRPSNAAKCPRRAVEALFPLRAFADASSAAPADTVAVAVNWVYPQCGRRALPNCLGSSCPSSVVCLKPTQPFFWIVELRPISRTIVLKPNDDDGIAGINYRSQCVS